MHTMAFTWQCVLHFLFGIRCSSSDACVRLVIFCANTKFSLGIPITDLKYRNTCSNLDMHMGIIQFVHIMVISFYNTKSIVF